MRLFYAKLKAAFEETRPGIPFSETFVTQLIWREFFYVMSVNNPHYGEMLENPICLNIDWYKNDEHLRKFEMVSHCDVIMAAILNFEKAIIYVFIFKIYLLSNIMLTTV